MLKMKKTDERQKKVMETLATQKVSIVLHSILKQWK